MLLAKIKGMEEEKVNGYTTVLKSENNCAALSIYACITCRYPDLMPTGVLMVSKAKGLHFDSIL